MKLSYKYWLAFASGIIVFLILLFLNPFNVDEKAVKVLAVGGLMITWWIVETSSMPAIALLPLILFPLLGISTVEEAATPYANPVVFLFLGGFMIGLAIEKWNLHRRIALNIVKVTGTSGDRIVLGFIPATGFISMWLSNTATTTMMFPIAAPVIHVMNENNKGDGRMDNFSVALMLAIAYSSNFGGIATIIGTPPNVAFAGFIQKKYGYTIGFADWMMVCFPLSLILLFTLYWVMVKWMYPNRIASNAATVEITNTEIHKLGVMSKAEKRVMTIFTLTASLWITKDLINKFGIIKLDDTMIAIFGAICLFLTPSGKEKKEERFVLDWSDTKRMAWGILLLFGGGISLANQLEKAGIIALMGRWMSAFAGSGGFMLVLITVLVSVFLSEVMSNVAQVIVCAPVIAGVADALNINPLLLGIPMTLGASCASMLPMGTPPNAIVFASGYIKLNQMIKTGTIMNIVSVVLITLFSWFLIPLLMTIAH